MYLEFGRACVWGFQLFVVEKFNAKNIATSM